jgi:uncharacterized membrane protein
MEILLLVVILVLIITLRSSILTNNDLVKTLKITIDNLQDEIRQLNKKINEGVTSSPGIKPEEFTRQTPAPVLAVVPEPITISPVEGKAEEPVRTVVPETEKSIIIEAPSYQPPIEYLQQEGWFDRWLKNNPDIEKFIGENLINKIGIAVLVLGIAFFVKYAIDQDWINETGRVGIGLLCGGMLIGLAHRMRNSYRSFSSVLVGGGLTVFYFTIAFAFHEYRLMSQAVAFITMIVITSFAVMLSMLYNRIELAILATIGGFVTPFLVTTGSNNHIALFTYLVVLNAGLIFLAYYKNWKPLNFIALFFTLLIYGSWFTGVAFDNKIPHADALLFATIFYFMFLAMNLINQFNTKDKLKAWDFGILMVINVCYYSVGMIILQHWNLLEYKGIFTASLGVINLILAYTLFKSKSLDKNFIYLLVGLTITYISLTAPVQLEGNYITLFWAAEAVLLLWLYQKSFIRLVKLSALLVTVCMMLSLFIDWVQVYDTNKEELLRIVLNKGVITSLFAAASLILSFLLLKKEADTYYYSFITNKLIRLSYFISAVTIVLLIGLIEINYQFTSRLPGTGINFIYLQLYAISFFMGVFIVADKKRWHLPDYVRILIIVGLFLLYLANTDNIYITETDILLSGKNTVHLFSYILNAILMIVLLLYSVNNLISRRQTIQKAFNGLITILSLALITVISIELRNVFIWSSYNHPADIDKLENLYAKAILSITWGVASFVMIWLGMKYKFKSLRITALALFGITIIKLFTFDISNIPAGGKIAAFILLGILLLVVSFMYQRLKKLIIDAPENN